ncbi:MAG TPA: 1-deoxy-D-xylulose-5-phosphate reductoisomerase [Thermomicrobiales bacterium]|nr:1-deoxy-D-xylulose-5-phosphate reductoisomerase [Thermomicrobiales bacterium]
MTGIALLGSTGSIGQQTLDVVRSLNDRYRVVTIAAGKRSSDLTRQVDEFQPALVVSGGDREIAGRKALPSPEGLIEAATHPDVDIVVVATSGHDAIPAVIAALQAGKAVALANKETIVCAGELIMPLVGELGERMRPVDSEHSAIWQSLQSGRRRDLRRIILTASGGPFRTTSAVDLANATVEQALKHPNWDMGGKITIDSATLMNKGLELIEARWLFDTPYEQIDIVVHPEQIIHSMVEFQDRSTIAQMSPPDMRLPIQYALTWPEHAPSSFTPLDFTQHPKLTFEQPDLDRFPALRIAREAGMAGRTYPTALSAADEVAVDAFRAGKIGFTDIPALIQAVLDRHEPLPVTDLDVVLGADRWARAAAGQLMANWSPRL